MQNSIVMLTTDSQIDRRILQEADSLESAGWKVTIIAMPKHEPFPDPPIVIRLPLTQGNEGLSKSLSLFRFYRWISRHLPLSSRIKKWVKKVAWFIFPNIETFYLNIFQDVATKYSPSIFVAHDLPMLPVACYAAAKCGAKVVYDSHELYVEQEFTNWEKVKWQKLEDKYIRKCDLIITINPMVAEELKKRYKLTSNVEVIYNAIPESPSIEYNKIFHQVFNLSKETQIVLFQGGLSANRNLEILVESMSCVTNPLLHLVILGDGPLKNSLQILADQLGITSRVHFHSAVPQEELLKYTACGDLGVIPYQAVCLNNYYCTPNKLFEFIAAGIPVLASDLPAIRSIVSSYQVGELADLSSAAKIASSLDSLFNNKGSLKAYAIKSQEAAKIVKWESDKIIKLFEEYKCA